MNLISNSPDIDTNIRSYLHLRILNWSNHCTRLLELGVSCWQVADVGDILKFRMSSYCKSSVKSGYSVYLPSLHFLGCHDDDSGVLLEHHPPEVADGVLQAALRSNVALLRLCVVALHLNFRLKTKHLFRQGREVTRALGMKCFY